MTSLNAVLAPPAVLERTGSSLVLPFMAGMAVNLASLAIGEPYQMMLVGAAVGLAATFAWSERPMAWMVFVAILCANPANTTTPIALNLYAAATFLMLARRSGWNAMPRMARIAFGFVMLSLAASIIASLWADLSIPTIHTTDVSRPRPWMITWSGGATLEILTTQFVSITNYLLGPFLLIPLVFSRLRNDHSPELLVRGMLVGLILPTLLMFLLARTFGRPTMDANALREGMLNVATFRLGKLDIQMIRTQVGIILAALICATFAISISRVSRSTRLLATGCLAISAYLLLVTGSVGSTIAGLAGLLLILALGKRRFSVKRYFLLMIVGLGLAVGTWSVLPPAVQRYAVTRYEVRVGKAGSPTADRSWRWRKSFNYLMDNPSGVGWSLFVEPLGIYPHNDYLTYAIAFGLVCGIVYFCFPCGLILSFVTLDPKFLDPSRFALALAGAGVTTVMLLNSLSDHMSANRWYFNVVWSLIWYAFFASRSIQNPFGSRSS
jgi:hypothetical protein